MTTEPAFTLAPAAIVRAASWPLDDLVALGDPSLADRAAHVDPDDAEARATLEADYEASIEAGRAHLWATTVADPSFRAALVLSSPGLHRQLGAGRRPRRRNKAARHLDTSLVRYLARACTRTEPFGLWTGVTLARFEDREATRFPRCAARARLAPELGPYRALIRELAGREPYLSRGPWRLNPTLRQDRDGQWSWARRRAQDGALRWRALPEVVGAGLRRALDRRCGSLDALREHLRAELGEAGDLLLELAVDQGLLVGGLGFAARYEDPWAALAGVEASLELEHATAWADVRRRAQALCEDLAVCLDAALGDPTSDEAEAASLADAVEEVDRALGALVAELAEDLGVEPRPDARSWLRCDLGAGWMVELGRADRRRLERILVDWSRLEREYRVGARRRAGAAARLRACPDGAVMAAPSGGDRRAEIAANEAPEAAPESEAGPPLGALVLRAGADGLARPWLRGLSDVPTATHARHAYHLAERGDPLLPWFRAQYREFAREGVEVVDLAYEHEASPNLLARPSYVPAVIAPWSADLEASLSADALLCPGPRPGSLLIQAEGRRMSLHAFTATATPPEDPILERLLASSFDGRANQVRTLGQGSRAPASTAAREPSTSTAILEPRRATLSVAEVESLAAVRRFERYRRWQRLAVAHELPELVRICIDARPGLVVPTSSPLALEAAFEGLRADSAVVVEEVVERGWLPGPRGAHVAELVVPLRRRDHLWRSRPEDLEHAVG